MPLHPALSRTRLKDRLFAATKSVRATESLLTAGKGVRRVILVGGAQRSGTTMMLRILDRSWQTEVFHERNRSAFVHCQLRDDDTVKRLADRSRYPVVVFKPLIDSHRHADLLRLLAPARGIWMFRHYDDVVNSTLKKWPGGRNRIDTLFSAPDQAGWRAEGISAETMETLRGCYHPGLNDASAQALFWFYRNQLFFDQGFAGNADVLLLEYEALVQEPEVMLPRIAAFADLRINPFMRKVANKRSIRRTAAPPIEPAVRALCDGMLERLSATFQAQRPSR